MPFVCNWNPSTTVLAHLGGAGIGRKKNDLHGAFACSSCHDELDGRTNSKRYTKEYLELSHRQAIERTQDYWLEIGFIKTANEVKK